MMHPKKIGLLRPLVAVVLCLMPALACSSEDSGDGNASTAGTGGTGSPSGCTAAAGDPCCADYTCGNGGCCVDGMCVAEGSECGGTEYGSFGSCQQGACATCGRSSLQCCGENAAVAVCTDGTRCEAGLSGMYCNKCGDSGQPCCGSEPKCNDGLTCSDTTFLCGT